jgi:hypothetical protein
MSGFEYFFTLYGLLLGLALTNVATGFADLMRGRETHRIGIVTPLLALTVVAFALGQWHVVYDAQAFYSPTPAQLITTLAITLPFVFVGQAMFPRDPDQWASLDDYCMDKRGILLGALMLSPAMAIASNAIVYGYYEPIETGSRILIGLILPAIAIVRRNRWLQAGVLLLNCGFYLVFRVFSII